MGYSVECFKSFNIRQKKDWSGDYEFQMIDHQDGEYIYPSAILRIVEYIESLGYDFDLVPNLGETNLESLSKKEADYVASRMVEPQKCLEFVKSNNIIEKVRENLDDTCLFVLENLIKLWSEEFYVIKIY